MQDYISAEMFKTYEKFFEQSSQSRTTHDKTLSLSDYLEDDLYSFRMFVIDNMNSISNGGRWVPVL